MPTITYTSNGYIAFQLWKKTTEFSGDEAQLAERVKIRKKIITTWPELETSPTASQIQERDLALSVDKSFDLNPTEQTAIAEGLLGFCKDITKTDLEKELCLDLAKRCRCSQWLSKQIGKREIRQFDESDEAPTVDVDAKTEILATEEVTQMVVDKSPD